MNYSNKGSYIEKIIPAAEMAEIPPPPYQDSCPVRMPDGDYLDLPFLALPPEFNTAIAFLCSNQTSFEVCDRLSREMAELAKEFEPEVVIGMPTLGMVYGSRVAQLLGHERYVPLGFSRKFWYEEELAIPVRSITSPNKPKTVYIDPRLLERLDGKRVILVEDVVSSGGTLFAEVQLCEKLGINLVGIVVANKETNDWVAKLDEIDPKYSAMVRAPISYPLFRKTPEGWVPDMSTMPPPNPTK
jgi:adenine/guanine phosphoribosyltransferase-like PRPP-binding protein